MTIREPALSDGESIRQIYLSAFNEEERELVADFAIELLNTETSPKSLHLVAEAGGLIVGHVSFSPVMVKDSHECIGYILAPLAVSPSHQNRGIASALVGGGLELVATTESIIVLVYGDPEFYGRFGFKQGLAKNYITPFQLTFPLGWQALATGGSFAESEPVEIQCVEPLRNPKLW